VKIADLCEDKLDFIVADGIFLDKECLIKVRAECENITLRDAGTGRGDGHEVNKGVRSDKIKFMRPEDIP